MLASKESPPVNSTTRFNKKGVQSLPLIPSTSNSFSAWLIALLICSLFASLSSSIGLETRIPPLKERSFLTVNASAISLGESSLTYVFKPE